MRHLFGVGLSCLVLLAGARSLLAQVPADPRFKTDVLLIVAHPDDESAVSSYLAQILYDQGKRVSVIYGTRGDGGGNTVGPEQAASLGAVREIEGRTALATLGIDHVWFLDGRDTPSQDVVQSLETWHHGSALEQTVRLVRLTRPEVIITWLPDFVIGENHGDHQAAGVIATEAFDLAGNPAAFPSQIAPARNRTGIGNLTEGLRPWQPKKLYYFTDRSEVGSLRTRGPAYPSTAVSPSRKVPYYQFTATLLAKHSTQGSEARTAEKAVATGDYQAFLAAQVDFQGTTDTQLLLGKSLVGGTATGDVFEGVNGAAIGFRPSLQAEANATGRPSIALGSPWRFYRAFWKAHDLRHLEGFFPPELGITPGATIKLPLVVENGPTPATFTFRVKAPAGWVTLLPAPVAAGPGEVVDLVLNVTAPSAAGSGGELEVNLLVGGSVVATLRLTVRALGTMPY